MLFWIFVLITIIGIIASIVTEKRDRWNESSSWAIFMTLFGGIVALVMVGIITINHVCLNGDIAANEARYEMLTYQLENDIYNNDNDLGKRELMVDIHKWNEDLARNKAKQHDFWIGIFTPNIYDQFEPITLKNTD